MCLQKQRSETIKNSDCIYKCSVVVYGRGLAFGFVAYNLLSHRAVITKVIVCRLYCLA